MKTLFFLICIMLLSNSFLSQDENNDEALNVFIDCYFCDMDYLRNNISYVNYVRDRKVAQVHVLTTTQRTGSGGTEYTFSFIGQLEFVGMNDTLSTVVKPDATSDERRELRSTFLKIGLMPYVAKTPMINFITIDYTKEDDGFDKNEVVDKWDSWVFRIGGNGWFNGQESIKSRNFNGYVSANRVTEKWKFENSGSYGYNETKFKIDSVTNFTNSNENYNLYNSAVLSLSDHWSTGLFISARSSTFSNNKFSYHIRPAIEYNVFKYIESTKKQIRFQYKVGYNDFQYRDTTIFNEISEGLFNHEFSVAAEFRQKWGSMSFSASASQYLHDLSLNNLSLWGNLSWRVVKGLTLDFNGSVNFIHDQISLARGGATDVEILTQQKQLATQFSYWGSVGVSYTFGSIYNNVVNPRFGN